MESLSKLLIVFGLVIVVIGGLLYWLSRLGLEPGRIPGDFKFQWNNITCILALGTSIIMSIILTIVFNILLRWLNR